MGVQGDIFTLYLPITMQLHKHIYLDILHMHLQVYPIKNVIYVFGCDTQFSQFSTVLERGIQIGTHFSNNCLPTASSRCIISISGLFAFYEIAGMALTLDCVCFIRYVDGF